MNGLVADALIVIFGLVSLVSGVAALAVLVLRRRLSRGALGTAAASGVLMIGCMIASPPGYSPAERDRIVRLHQQFAPALERYRQAHGQYPPTLEAAGIPTPQTEYGPLRYRNQRGPARQGTPYYEIGFGDYIQNGFVAWWDSDSRRWYLDQ
jgi:hypothetical protein